MLILNEVKFQQFINMPIRKLDFELTLQEIVKNNI